MNMAVSIAPKIDFFFDSGDLCWVTLRNNDEEVNVPISKLWINDQPFLYLNGLSEDKIRRCVFQRFDASTKDLSVFSEDLKKVSLEIKTVAKKILHLEVDPDHLLAIGLKRMIQRKNDILKEFKVLSEEMEVSPCILLNKLNIKEPFEIYIEDPLKEINNITSEYLEGPRPTAFVDFQSKTSISFSDKEPIWRSISRGFNLIARCGNLLCPTVKDESEDDSKGLVCVELKYGQFSIAKLKNNVCCPECKLPFEKFEILNCILWDCFYSIEGKDLSGTSNFTPPTLVSDPITFGEGTLNDPFGHIKKWTYLIITVNPLKEKVSLLKKCSIL